MVVHVGFDVPTHKNFYGPIEPCSLRVQVLEQEAYLVLVSLEQAGVKLENDEL